MSPVGRLWPSVDDVDVDDVDDVDDGDGDDVDESEDDVGHGRVCRVQPAVN